MLKDSQFTMAMMHPRLLFFIAFVVLNICSVCRHYICRLINRRYERRVEQQPQNLTPKLTSGENAFDAKCVNDKSTRNKKTAFGADDINLEKIFVTDNSKSLVFVSGKLDVLPPTYEEALILPV